VSANTTIQEGGKDYPFGPVKCLMVEGDNGEFYPWYREADRALDSLSVDKNGIYRASDRGVYGWDRVSVNVAQTDRVTGRDPDSGDEKTVTVDPETGELVETVVPVEIRIETPPTFTGPYDDGSYINFTGLTVAAYGVNGDKMLDVPFNELIFPVTTAMPGEVIEVFDDELVPPVYLLPVSVGNTIAEYQAGEWYRYYYSAVTGGPVYVVCLVDSSTGNGESIFVSMYPFSVTYERTHPSGWDSHRVTASGGISVYGNYSAYVGGGLVGANLFVNGGYTPISTNQPIGLVNAAILAINKVAAGEAVSVATVPVQWSRTGDGKILETSFEITVAGGD